MISSTTHCFDTQPNVINLSKNCALRGFNSTRSRVQLIPLNPATSSTHKILRYSPFSPYTQTLKLGKYIIRRIWDNFQRHKYLCGLQYITVMNCFCITTSGCRIVFNITTSFLNCTRCYPLVHSVIQLLRSVQSTGNEWKSTEMLKNIYFCISNGLTINNQGSIIKKCDNSSNIVNNFDLQIIVYLYKL